MVRGISAGSVTRKLCLVIGIVMPRMSASWKASVPIAAAGHLAGHRDHRHRVHVGVGDRGDQVGRARAAGRHADADPAGGRRRSPGRRGRRPARAGPGCAGSCSESKSGSYAGRIAPPGMPKTFSAPAHSSDLIRLCAPVTGVPVPCSLMIAFLGPADCRAQQKTPRPGGQTRGDACAWEGFGEPVLSRPRRERTRMSKRMRQPSSGAAFLVKPVCQASRHVGTPSQHPTLAGSSSKAGRPSTLVRFFARR